MTIQLIDIFHINVFRRYSTKYNIYRELYENDLLALEIRDIDYNLSKSIKRIILTNKEICYSADREDRTRVDLLVLGSFAIFKELAKEIIAIGNEDLGQKVSRTLTNISDYNLRSVQIGTETFPLTKTYSIGIVNVTPDSFSDGGKYCDANSAAEHALKLLDDGARIIDIGGESSRPGAISVGADEELKRISPVIAQILRNRSDALISVDTTKAAVAEETLKMGARIVNDISSCSHDKLMLDVIKKYNASIVLMHMKGNPNTMQQNPYYDDVVTEIYDYLDYKTNTVKKNGINSIIIDPGIGFGKRVIDNYEIIKRLNEFKGLGFPILIGLSKKSFIGKSLNLEIDEREDSSLVLESYSINNGARFIRTHTPSKTVVSSKINFLLENPEMLLNV